MEDPWDMEKVLTEFGNEIPSEQHFYLLVKEYTAEPNSTDIPSWADTISKVMLVSFIILSLQAVYNLYVVITLGGFTLGQKTSLGMWNFETINCNTLTSLIFSILSIIDWLWAEHIFSVHQIGYPFAQNLIAHGKFVPVALGTWCFVWATVCHCVSIFWYRRNHASCTREKASLPTYAKCIFHALFLLPVVVITIWVLLSTFHFHENRMRENEAMIGLKIYLSQVDDGSTDHRTLISKILVLMRKVNSSRIESIKSLNMVILTYLTSDMFLLSVFTPLLCVSWRDLKVKADFLAQRLQQERHESSDGLAKLMETTQDARATLLYRSLSVFFGLASCAPGMCWELYYSHKYFSTDYAYYRIVSTFLSQGVISLFLNIHILIVNLHCRRLKVKQREPKKLQRKRTAHNRKLEPSIPLNSTTETLEADENPGIFQPCY